MTSSENLKQMNETKREKQKKMAQQERATLLVLNALDRKRLMSVATTVQWSLPFCIAICSVDLFGSVFEYGLAFDFDDIGREENIRVRVEP